ncbi:MAG: ABC transporter ATP-binding protein [Eubacteriales bacterium]|nr:ABC transporter ATP-binding protein [Eubacteriales bacterium]
MKQKIEVCNISKSINKKIIFANVSGTFKSGNIYGFIGRNGSGKTVFFKCLCGFMEVSEGKIMQNKKLLKKDCEFLENCGFLIENPGFLSYESGYHNLKYLAAINGKIGKEQIYESIRQVGLDPEDKKRVGKYSLGMRQRLGIAQAIMEDPDILVLDEPMNGLDNEGVGVIRNLLLEQKEKGKIIFIASHYKEDIEYLCDETYCFNSGKCDKAE